MLYYRSDCSQDGVKPPETWDDYSRRRQKVQCQDLNGDGKPDYGSCLFKAPSSNLLDHYGHCRFVIRIRGRVGTFLYDGYDAAADNNDAFRKRCNLQGDGEFGPPKN